MAGNKCDLFEEEEVEEEEAKNYAKEIGAYFQLTSAFQDIGIKDIFNYIGCKILDPDYVENNEIGNDDNNNKNSKDNNNGNKEGKHSKHSTNDNVQKNVYIQNRDSVRLDPDKAKKSNIKKKKCC